MRYTSCMETDRARGGLLCFRRWALAFRWKKSTITGKNRTYQYFTRLSLSHLDKESYAENYKMYPFIILFQCGFFRNTEGKIVISMVMFLIYHESSYI